MKLNAKQKQIIKLMVENKGEVKTKMIPKEQTDKNLDNIVTLYLSGLLVFKKKYDIDIVGPYNEHKVRYAYYLLTMNKKKTINDLKQILKEGYVD
jgi:hypothetical protein|tara:strand:- start:260 stop:544 length:285 start_codon:yes stop_codon:yes gene_type:complete